MCSKVTHSFADVVLFIAESWFLESEWNTYTCVILNSPADDEKCNAGAKYCVAPGCRFSSNGGKQTKKIKRLCSSFKNGEQLQRTVDRSLFHISCMALHAY